MGGPGNQRVAAEGPAPTAADWDRLPLRKLIQYILAKHHSYLRRELPLVEQMIAEAGRSRSREHSEPWLALRKIFQQFRRDLEDHLKKEEVILFPLIEKLEAARAAGQAPERAAFGSLSHPAEFMKQDHELGDRLLAKTREIVEGVLRSPGSSLTDRDLSERLKALAEDLNAHVHLEDDILFPSAIRLESS
jgi:regulator of cell morphogenesis and NO signaling